MTEEHMRLIEQVAALQTSHEIDRLLQLFADDATFEDVALGIVANGHAKIREMFESIYASMPDCAMTLVSAVADKRRGGAEWVMSGTHMDDFPGLPASGKSFSLQVAAMIRFSNGRISHWTDYWSVSTFKEQVGLEGNTEPYRKSETMTNSYEVKP
jgi:steroid delta-isomerase-like uncharacterized protein